MIKKVVFGKKFNLLVSSFGVLLLILCDPFSINCLNFQNFYDACVFDNNLECNHIELGFTKNDQLQSPENR